MPYKTIVVLAKSYKIGGWCVAGRELIEKRDRKYEISEWVRPVSADVDSHGAIFDRHCMLKTGISVGVLDIVRVPIQRRASEPAQPENFQIIEGTPWEKIDKYSPKDVGQFIDKPDNLWLEGGIETDRISLAYEETGIITQSLYLIKPQAFHVSLSYDWNNFEEKYKKKISADFTYRGVHYEGLSVTDPKVRQMLGGEYPRKGGKKKRLRLKQGDNYYLCVSLGPRFGKGDRHYKFIAAVFDHDGYIQEQN